MRHMITPPTRSFGPAQGLLAAALVLAVTACAARRPPQPPGPERRLTYANNAQMLEASNGLRMLVLPDTSTNLVEIDVRFDVGSAEDPEGKAGLAHLVEHLMFQMRPFGADQPSVAAVLGASALGYNAYTTWDATHYTAVAPRDSVDEMVRIALAHMSAGCAELDAEAFEREREVVRNEIRQRTATPDGQILQLLHEAIYPDGHPYRRMVGGDDLQLASIEMSDVCAFVNDYYAPSRATLIVAGNTTLDEVKQVANKYLGAVPARTAQPRTTVARLELAQVTEYLDANVEDATAFLVFRMPGRFDDDELAARVYFGVGGRSAASARRLSSPTCPCATRMTWPRPPPSLPTRHGPRSTSSTRNGS